MDLVTYTDPTAIRFARKEDAENMMKILRLLSGAFAGIPFTAVEHSWG
jgi:hypothetical protein